MIAVFSEKKLLKQFLTVGAWKRAGDRAPQWDYIFFSLHLYYFSCVYYFNHHLFRYNNIFSSLVGKSGATPYFCFNTYITSFTTSKDILIFKINIELYFYFLTFKFYCKNAFYSFYSTLLQCRMYGFF